MKVVSKLLYGLLALVIFSAVYWYEFSKTGSDFHQAADFVTEQGEISHIEAPANEAKTILVGNAGVVRLAPGTVLDMRILKKDGYAQVVLQLEHGRLWVNGAASGYNFVVTTATKVPAQSRDITLWSSQAIFDVRRQDGEVTVAAHLQSLAVDFLSKALIVYDGTALSISENKIKANGNDIAKLRFAKLTKEFPLILLGKDDQWTAENKKQDAVFRTALSKETERILRLQGGRVPLDTASSNTALRDTIINLSNTVTLDKGKRTKRLLESYSNHVDTAAFALLIGNDTQARALLNKAEVLRAQISSSPQYADTLRVLYDRYGFSHTTDTFFPIKSILRTALYYKPIDQMRARFQDIIDESHIGSDAATEQRVISLLRAFGTSFDTLKSSNLKSQRGPDELFLLSRDVRNFVGSSSSLLREEFLRIVDQLESFYLELLSTREVSLDERQFLILDKLSLIKLIRANLDKGKIPFQDASRAMQYLVSRIESLKPSVTQSAFIAYFDAQFAELNPFIAFLRSSDAQQVNTEYLAAYKDYQSKVSDATRIREIITNAQGGQNISPVTREKMATKVLEHLGGIGLENIKMALSDDEHNTRVRITDSLFEGKKFTCIYDTDTQVLSEIIIDGAAVTNAIRLDSARTFLLIKIGKLKMPVGKTDESFAATPRLSPVEEVAKSTVLGKLNAAGITVEEKYLDFADFSKGTIHVLQGVIGEGTDAILFSADITQNMTTAEHIKVQTVEGELPLNENFSLADLALKLGQITQRAKFDKQREEEMKDLVR